MKKLISFYLLVVFMVACYNSSENKTTNQNDDQEIINLLIDSVLNQYSNYSICGDFSKEIPDSIFMKILDKFSELNIIENEDVDTISQQYLTPKYQELHEVIDTLSFKVIKHLDHYVDRKFYDMHFAFSVPLYTKDANKCIIYLIAYLPGKENSDVFLIFEKDDEKWNKASMGNLEISYPIEEYHYHNYSLVPNKIFNE